MSITVTAINYHQKQRILEVSFAHGQQARFSAEFLRVYSPSAEVIGHSPEQATLVANKKAITIEKISPIGNYAVKIYFDDGHNSGLYSWSYLENLRQNQPRLWQDYLAKLKAANARREPVIGIKICR